MPPTSGTVKAQPSESLSASPSSMLSSGVGKHQQDEGEMTKGKAQPDPGLTSQSLSEQPRKAMRMSTGTKAPRRSSLLAASSSIAASASQAQGASAGPLSESAGRNASSTAVNALTAQLLEWAVAGALLRLSSLSGQKKQEGMRTEDVAQPVQGLALASSKQPQEQKPTVPGIVATQAHASAKSALQDDSSAVAASAASAAVTSMGMPDLVSLLTRKAEQQSVPGPKDLQTAVVRVPEMIANGGQFWLQAERDHCTSAPFALPTYSTVHEPKDASQQYAHWRRFMYPEALSRKAR